ncbi:MAG: enhanced intracellular survival protein Eis, partial [Promethearchaeota archaeon]
EPKGLPRTSKKHVNYLEIKDIKLVTDCFNRCASSRYGLMLRSEDRFDRIFQRNYVVGYKKNGHVLGYVVFHFQDKENYLRYNLTIEELIYETPEALSEILTFLNTQQDQINKVVFNTPDNNFYLLLSDPRSRENKSLFLNSQETNISGVGAMYRVINVPEFFLNLNTHNFGDQTLKLRIDIQDSFLMENNRSILIHFKNGKPNVIEDSDDYEVSISLDIARFSSMVMGAISFKKLYSYSLVEISKTEFIDSINKVFLCEEPPMTFDEC